MVFIAAALSDRVKGQFGVFLCKIHTDLTGLCHFTAACAAVDGFHGDVEIVGYDFLNVFDRYLLCCAFHVFVDHVLCKVDGNFLVVDGRLCKDGDHGSFKFTDVGGDAQGDVFGDFRRELDAVIL